MDPLSLIVEVFDPVAGRHILDVGCGSGALTRALVDRGAVVTGVEPGDAAIALARRKVPEARFLQVSALAIPLPSDSVDGAVFLNSLHHVPDPRGALREAGRVVRMGSRLVVIEPLASGSFFDVLRHIEDETTIRGAAQTALAEAVTEGEFHCERDFVFDRAEVFETLESFLARVVAVDPDRQVAVDANRHRIEESFQRHAERDADGRHVLRQPLRAHVLTCAPP